jgi:FkbM family methyltransferase
VSIAFGRSAQLQIPSDSPIGAAVFARTYEPSELDFVRRFLRSGDTFWDIGANFGVYSVLAGSLVTAAGSVMAFEPLPAAFAWLEKNLSQFGPWCRAENAAVGAQSGRRFLTTKSGLDPWATVLAAEAGVSGNLAARVVTPGEMLRNGARVPSLVKIDTEGSELSILKGDADLLHAGDGPTFLIEFNEQAASIHNSGCQFLRSFLETRGYTLFSYRRRHWGEPVLQALPSASLYDDQNVVATRDPNALLERLGSCLVLGGP